LSFESFTWRPVTRYGELAHDLHPDKTQTVSAKEDGKPPFTIRKIIDG
jgi:hypothetical protein